MDFSGTTLEVGTRLESFGTSLPSGANKIGKVDIDNIIDYTAVLNNIEKAAEKAAAVYLSSFYSDTAVAVGKSYTPTGNNMWHEIAFCSNDGETPIAISMVDGMGRTMTMQIKAGEVLNNIRCYCSSVKISGSGSTYRVALVERGA